MTPLKTAVGIASIFVILAVGIFAAAYFEYVSIQLAMLLLVALLGMYLGFGFLIAVWRLTSTLK